MSIPSEPGALPPPAFIPLSVPEIAGREWEYIKDCLDTGWVSSVGAYVDQFEKKMADYIGVSHAVATVNGTSALHIALLVAGIQPDDEVLIPSLTFIATANAVRYAQAWPVFIDAEPDHWQMDPQLVADFCEHQCEWKNGVLRNRITGRRVWAILPVHILGHPVDLEPLIELAQRFGLAIIEDNAESLGARYRGKRTGSLGDLGCLSFNGNKVMTTGAGGMILTNNESFATKARYLTTQAKDDPLEYIHHEMGFNYRLCNIQAAMGCAQLERLDDSLQNKKRIARTYAEAFASIHGLQPMLVAEWADCIHWLYSVRVDPITFGMSSRELLKRLHRDGIQSRPLWQPMHLSPAFRDLPPTHCPVAETLYQNVLSLPSSVGLSPEDQERVIQSVCGARN